MSGFSTPLRVEQIDALANDGRGLWRLIDDLVYEARDGISWTVPAGFVTDYASVPRAPMAFWLTGDTAHAPAVLHDWAIRTRACPRPDADLLFLAAMEDIGMPEWRIGLMYRAVSAVTRSQQEKEGTQHG